MTQIHLKPTFEYTFDQIRANLGKLFVEVSSLIKSAVTLDELKRFLRFCFPELKLQLSLAESFDDVMDVVRENCTIINVACLEAIVEHYKIENAKAHIASYKLEVETFSLLVNLIVCDNDVFTPSSFSQPEYEIIEFVLDWMIDEHKLYEINGLLCKAFGSMAKRVLVKKVNKENSIIVTCYASCILVHDLQDEVEMNHDILKKMGVIKVTFRSNKEIEQLTKVTKGTVIDDSGKEKPLEKAEKQTTPTITMASPVSQDLSVLAKLLQTKSLTEEEMSLKCDDRLFLKLSSQIPCSGLGLCLSLGLRNVDAVRIERDNHSEKQRIIATFVEWKKRNGSDATYLALVKIFMQCEDHELAEFILDYFISSK